MDSIPVYIVARGGPVAEQCLAAFPGAAQLAPPFRSSMMADHAPGLVLLDLQGSGVEEVLEAGEALGGSPGWTLAVVSPGAEGSAKVRTVSVGYDHTLAEAAEFTRGGGDGNHLLELHRVLAEIAKARHDINNPLTSALAEVQILLLDAAEGEERESLETIQEQLRRLRDMVAATRHLRTRRRG